VSLGYKICAKMSFFAFSHNRDGGEAVSRTGGHTLHVWETNIERCSNWKLPALIVRCIHTGNSLSGHIEHRYMVDRELIKAECKE
jgi:hypothetical protein